MKAFYLDPLPWHEGYAIITNNFDKIKMPPLHTSYRYLEALLVDKSYEDYLYFCKEFLGAKIYRKDGAKYASIHFPITKDVNRFVGILNRNFEKGYNEGDFSFSNFNS